MEIITGTTILVVSFAIALALLFDFTNGFHDSANLVATAISSNAVSPAPALVIAAVAEFIGAFFLGTAVAQTIGKGIVDPTALVAGSSGVTVIIAALFAAIAWNIITWFFGIPSSSSHALIGGLIGAFISGWGIDAIHWDKVLMVVVVMLLSPFVGFLITFIVTRLTMIFSQWTSPRVNRFFRRAQIVSIIAQALSHGTNDAQKTMGIITFVLVIAGWHQIPASGAMTVPSWVIAACSGAIALGTLTGGWRIIKKLGAGLYRVRPVHAFASQVASSAIIYTTAVFGFPISTTQVITSSVMGAGAATRPKMVRWFAARNMAMTWLVTLPASGALAWLVLFAFRHVF